MNISKNTLLLIIVAVTVLAVIVVFLVYSGSGTMMKGGMIGGIN